MLNGNGGLYKYFLISYKLGLHKNMEPSLILKLLTRHIRSICFKELRFPSTAIILGAGAVGIFFTCILGASLWYISAHSKDTGKTVNHDIVYLV